MITEISHETITASHAVIGLSSSTGKLWTKSVLLIDRAFENAQ